MENNNSNQEVRETTVFNPIQQQLLLMFAHEHSEDRLKEIQQLLCEYYAKKLDEETDKLWESGVLSQQKLDELRGQHLRAHVGA